MTSRNDAFGLRYHFPKRTDFILRDMGVKAGLHEAEQKQRLRQAYFNQNLDGKMSAMASHLILIMVCQRREYWNTKAFLGKSSGLLAIVKGLITFKACLKWSE